MENWSPLKCILLMLLCSWNTNSQVNDDIRTSSGTVRGNQIFFDDFAVTQYLGVPYAEPPVGELRFKKPKPVKPWNETYMADSFPPACIQYSEYPFPWHDFEDGKSEDCLYLNIWVPVEVPTSDYKFPTMFWIHGGGFTDGSSRKSVYHGQTLAAHGDVIVVTINYRLGAFGFLTSDNEEAPGNVGIYDILVALKWVNKNIAAFGGDPNNLTLFGDSSGSILVGLFCVSPLTEGLFQRVIMQSGSPAHLLGEDNTFDGALSQNLGKAVGCADDTTTIHSDPGTVVSCLRGVDAIELAKTLNSFNPTSAIAFIPKYGDDMLPKNPRTEIINGNFHNVDILIGDNKDEYSFFISTANPEVFGFFGEKNQNINKSYGEMILMNFFGTFGFPYADDVIEHYLGSADEDDYDHIREQVYTAIGDYILLCPDVYFAEQYSRADNDVGFYFFVHRPSTTPWADWMGVMHYEEVQFVFGVPLQKPQNYTREEIDLSKEMIQIWTTFAKNGTRSRDWPSYSREKPTYVELNTGIRTTYGEGPHKDNCDFFRKFFGFE